MAEDIVLNEWERTLCATIRARQPGVIVQTLEEERVLWSLTNAAQWMAKKRMGKRDITLWSAVTRKTIRLENPDEVEDKDACLLPQALHEFLQETVTVKDKEVPAPGLMVLADVHSLLDEHENIRALREACWEIGERNLRKTIVICGKPFSVPEELGAEFRIFPYALPTYKDILSMCEEIIAEFKSKPSHEHIKPTKAQIKAFARACAGLSENEARGLLRLAVAKYETLDNRAVKLALDEKAAIVRRGGAMTVVEPDHGLDEVGGLQFLKKYLNEVGFAVANPEDAKAYGLCPPSGFLFIGIPGCGKSYTVKALGAAWNLPVLKLDMGSIFGGTVGESEANTRQFMQMAEAVAPCVVFIDEIEKGLGGGGGGERDGGTSERVMSTLLSWLNDKPDGVIVAATANDLAALESRSELLRAGRFDEIFFVDLPDLRSRLEILAIHLKKVGHTISQNDLMTAAKATKGYSGAELEVVVQGALRRAFITEPRPEHPTGEQLVAAIEDMIPLSKSMANRINGLRQWVKDGKAKPAGALLESDKADEKAFEDEGLPILCSEGD